MDKKASLTEQEILEMSNTAKRKDFLKTYETWELWEEAPLLGLTVYRVGLPDGKFIIAATYKSLIYGRVEYGYQAAGDYFSPFHKGESEICERLMALRKDVADKAKKELKDS
jgi:hypothetical protein